MAGIRVGFGQPQAPRSVEQITKAAQNYEYDADVPMRYWLRTAAALVKEADIYQREGDDETTYFLLFRHAHLVLANLASHPGVRDERFRTAWKEANESVQHELKLLDRIRPKINERYERYKKLLQEREARAQAQQRHVRLDDSVSYDERHFDWQKARQVDANEHKDFAARLAHREHSRRAVASNQSVATTAQSEGDDLQRRLQAIRARVDSQEQPISAVARPSPSERHDSGYKYPDIPARGPQHSSSSPVVATPLSNQLRDPLSLPALPPKPDPSNIAGVAPPVRPEKIPQDGFAAPAPARPDTPTDDRLFAATAHLENGTALRTIFLPATLRTTFLRIAYKNTQANLETCGFLAGTLMKNAFFVSKLVIPSQTATSDTCEMTNESELFDYVDASDLMILGWIHTSEPDVFHEQSRSPYAFRISDDAGRECGYCLCPSKGDTSRGGDYGVYRLTDPPGKKAILSCEKPGIFHPHDTDNIYTDAMRPGHVVEVQDMPFDVIDLR